MLYPAELRARRGVLKRPRRQRQSIEFVRRRDGYEQRRYGDAFVGQFAHEGKVAGDFRRDGDHPDRCQGQVRFHLGHQCRVGEIRLSAEFAGVDVGAFQVHAQDTGTAAGPLFTKLAEGLEHAGDAAPERAGEAGAEQVEHQREVGAQPQPLAEACARLFAGTRVRVIDIHAHCAVPDAARVLDVIAGYDPKEDLRYVWSFELKIIGSNSFYDENLKALMELIEQGRMNPVVDEVLPLERAADLGERLPAEEPQQDRIAAVGPQRALRRRT